MAARTNIPAGRLYISGHAQHRGYAVDRYWSDAECSSVPCGVLETRMTAPRFIVSRAQADRLVQRWNRRFASH